MSTYYNSRRTRNLFSPSSKKPYEISRSSIDLFLKCPRCFYLNKRLGTATPPAHPYTLSTAVDTLLKKEYNIFRSLGIPHPIMTYSGINCVPYAHAELDKWRDSLRGGIRYLHAPTNLIVKGGVDDIWIDTKNELHIVDYKSTSKAGELHIDADWQTAYKRQVEIYQWLFRKNGFTVSNTAYFVYVNAVSNRPAFESKLEFDTKIIAYEGDDRWVEDTILRLHKCLISPDLPTASPNCDYCAYYAQRTYHEKNFRKSKTARSSNRNPRLE